MRQFGRLTIILFVVMLSTVTAAWMVGGGAQPLGAFPSIFLTNSDGRICKQPCIFGIRPGETFYNQALKMLRKRGTVYNYARRRGVSSWEGDGFHFVITNMDYDLQRTGKTTSMYLDFRKTRYMPDPMHISVDEVIRFFGRPQRIDQHQTTLWLYYPSLALIVELEAEENATLDSVSNTPVARLHFPIKEAYNRPRSGEVQTGTLR